MNLLISFFKNLLLIIFLTLTIRSSWSANYCRSSVYASTESDSLSSEGCGGISKVVGTNVEVEVNTSYLFAGYYVFVFEVVGEDRISDNKVYTDPHYYKEVYGYVNEFGELETDLPFSSISYYNSRNNFNLDFKFPINNNGNYRLYVDIYEDYGWERFSVCRNNHVFNISYYSGSTTCNNVLINDSSVVTYENQVIERRLQCLD
jgi:hypothetical protein